MKIIRLSILFATALVFLVNCGGSSCDEDDDKYFDIQGLELSTLGGENRSFPSRYDQLAFTVNSTKIKYYSIVPSNLNLFNYIIPDAHASCTLISKEKIHAVSISVAPEYFTDPALNENMELFFEVTRGFNRAYSSGKNLSDIIKEGVNASREFSIKLTRPPAATGVYQFRIDYSHIDGESYQLYSNQLAILGENDMQQ